MTLHDIVVTDMVCEGCVDALRRAIAQADPQAEIEVLLGEQRLKVRSELDRGTLTAAISNAGYTPN
jgi:copper chaperone CopZ